MKYDFMQQLFGLSLEKGSLKLLAYMVQSSDMPASDVDGCMFMLASNDDGHGNHSCNSCLD